MNPPNNKITNTLIKRLPTLVLFLVAIIFIWWAVRLGQDVNWDLLNYHYYNPYALIHGRIGWDIAPAMQQSFHNSLLDLPTFFLIKNLPPIGVGLILAGLQIMNLWLIWRLASLALKAANLKFPEWFALIIATLGFAGAGNIGELGGTMGDNLVSILVLIVLLNLINPPQKYPSPDSRFKIFNISLVTGIFVSLKMTTFIFVPGILILLVYKNRRQWLKTIIISLIGLAGGFILLQAHLMLVLWQNFSNPLFPYLNNLFRSPFTYLHSNTDPRLLPHNLLELILYPFIFTFKPHRVSEVAWQDIRFFLAHAYIIIAVPIIMAQKWINKKYSLTKDNFLSPGSSLTIFYIVSYLVWAKLFGIYRYIIVLEFLAPLVIFFLAWSIWEHNKNNKVFFWRYLSAAPLIIMIGATILGIINYKPMDWGRVAWQNNDYFGLNKNDFIPYKESTIFLGEGPQAYIIPYFPASTRFVRIYAPNRGEFYDSLNYQALVPETIYKSERLYALVDPPGYWTQPSWLMAFTAILRKNNLIITNDCQEIPVIINLRPDRQAYYPLIYRYLCKIEKSTTTNDQ